MRNYVKEMEFIMEKKNSVLNFLSPLFSGLFFIAYSGLIFIYSQEYYKIFLAFGSSLAIAIPCFALCRTSLTDDERAVRNEIREARKFLEKSSGKADNQAVNALVNLYRSGMDNRKWESIEDMFREAFPEKSELRKTVTGILEGGK